MKQRFLTMILVGIITALSAGAQTTNSISINAGDYKNICIAKNMDVVLFTGLATTSTFSVSKEAEEVVNVKFSGKTLRVENKAGLMKGTIYLTVHSLEQLTLGESTVVHVDGLVTTPELQLFIEANAKAYVTTIGKINAHSTSNAELLVEPMRPNGRTDKVVLF